MPNYFLYILTTLFQTIQFSSIWLIDRTSPGATTPGQSGPVSDGNIEQSAFPRAPALPEPHNQIV